MQFLSFRLHSNSKIADDILDVKQFFTIFDFIFSQSIVLQPNLQKQLEFLYPKLKVE
jgi:hypothetical protein